MATWISVDTALPEFGVPVLVTYHSKIWTVYDKPFAVAQYVKTFNSTRWIVHDDNIDVDSDTYASMSLANEVTHWLPFNLAVDTEVE